ncbi:MULTISPECIES: N-acetylglucosamine-6-phosphate deacetylase [Mediterraneibacter]|uniref:N-acetylglucosamine-6-phosphate deacetylase n=1 Tax=Mediterraneibacter TaxID=2316020 RepID=UPI0011C1A35E|nr:amidohydrolase family protein [Mediterraneibacter massiliensis]
MKKIINAKVMTPYRYLEGYDVAYENRKIVKIDKNIENCEEIIDGKGLFLAPGYIDLHIHGGGGYSFIEENEAAVSHAMDEVVKHGVTSVLASHMVPVKKLGDIYQEYMKNTEGPEILGLHAECVDWEYIYGDPINKGKEASDYSVEKCKKIVEEIPVIKRIGIDPCIKGADEITRYFVSNGVSVSISHCGPADYTQVMKCVEAGANSVTHLYTGMSGFYRDADTGERFPGLIEDCLLEPDIYAEVIGNGKHLTGSMLDLIYRNKGVHGMYLVTDAATREEPFAEGEEMVVPNRLPDRISIKTMAPMDYIVQKTYQYSNIPLLDVIRMATLTPAQVIGVDDHKGKICEGYDADFILLDKELNIKAVIARGRTCKGLEE